MSTSHLPAPMQAFVMSTSPHLAPMHTFGERREDEAGIFNRLAEKCPPCQEEALDCPTNAFLKSQHPGLAERPDCFYCAFGECPSSSQQTGLLYSIEDGTPVPIPGHAAAHVPSTSSSASTKSPSSNPPVKKRRQEAPDEAERLSKARKTANNTTATGVTNDPPDARQLGHALGHALRPSDLAKYAAQSLDRAGVQAPSPPADAKKTRQK
ncbi:uncharacterized protein EHS24_005705 [Apiotrichum porosum]|uniref:Uncharacterized protein n=1 Tax=Apiotrichum porosum TaxID=105984 RepID=A0A427XZ89_9TREE|nr:uncharacterized protein EHS24_005705 [Apiotrichum porosum]RSH84196.1 hypothetical protein EHS24_005705 [Apiotrichum porosum]